MNALKYLQETYCNVVQLREAAKKVLLLMAGPLRGGGVKGRAIKERRTVFGTFFLTL